MGAQLGKKFIGSMLGVVLALGTFTWFAAETHRVKDVPTSQAYDANAAPGANATSSPQSVNSYPNSDAQAANQPPGVTVTDPGSGSNGSGSTYDQGYLKGYQDGQRDCPGARSSSVAGSGYTTQRTSYARSSYTRHGVAGERYYAVRHKNHSTRNMILTVAAPAALAAGIGGIAGGGKGAGIGALLGGGGGALYYLIKHRHSG